MRFLWMSNATSLGPIDPPEAARVAVPEMLALAESTFSLTPDGGAVAVTGGVVRWHQFTDPDYPMSPLDQSMMAVDRESLGGAPWSRVYGLRRSAEWAFSNVHSEQILYWRHWYRDTMGGRIPFAVDVGSARYLVVAPGPFPLELTGFERWGGSLSLREAIGWL